MELKLPDNPTKEDLIVIEQYLKTAKKKLSKSGWGKKDFYSNKKSLMGNKLIIYQPTHIKSDNFHMRYYVGDRKYKVLSLGTNHETKATEKALEKWRLLSNQLEAGGAVFEKTIVENLDEYFQHLEQLVASGVNANWSVALSILDILHVPEG